MMLEYLDMVFVFFSKDRSIRLKKVLILKKLVRIIFEFIKLRFWRY